MRDVRATAEPTTNTLARSWREEPRVVTRIEREAAVRSWLLLSAAGADTSRTDWDENGIALLRCGALFSTVRMSAELVEAAAGSNEPEKVRDVLTAALFGGPVFVDTHSGRYYALVPASTANRAEWRERRHAPHAEIRGRDSYVGVPRPGLDEPHPGRFSYWCVPMHGPADLCDPAAVSQLVAHGRHRLTTREAVSGR
ncbi:MULTISPECIES: hypothetical protein [Streptomyces]|uniref:DNA primase/polymerase bifunctional N-terminal domain-containing protein n=1 Tax=Streptomyces canarius TaxID=285453 RepID=A0ABQ3CFG2_9ACTN|nr:hypothetical protein [Streptomyces canarius]GHA09285.1 hypothetical protein GCM10010345_12190 [Streptomyces canarius]